jgi:hypothetical protein
MHIVDGAPSLRRCAITTAAGCMGDDRILLTLKTAWADGTRHLIFAPMELLEKLRRAKDESELPPLPGVHRSGPLCRLRSLNTLPIRPARLQGATRRTD